jgi:acyl-coenzyme A synthetase/AMP-(fatty) acid ligase
MPKKASKYDFLLDRLEQHVTSQPDKTAATFLSPGPQGGKVQKQYTYSEIHQESTRIAQYLLSQGLKAGEWYVIA